MEIKRIITGSLNTNTYICYEGKKGFVVDPGGIIEPDIEVVFVINTHGHFDHIKGNRHLVENYNAELLIHSLDREYLLDTHLNGSELFGEEVTSPEPDKLLRDGEVIEFQGHEIKIIHTPGHTPGSICIQVDNYLFTGDTLMLFGVGRTDLPGGDEELLWHSISNLMEMDDELICLPGHGPSGKLSELKGGLGYAF